MLCSRSMEQGINMEHLQAQFVSPNLKCLRSMEQGINMEHSQAQFVSPDLDCAKIQCSVAYS